MTERVKTHIISHLGLENDIVKEEVEKSNSKTKFHEIKEPADENNFAFARKLTNQITDLPIRVGSVVIFVMGANDILIENLCVSAIQRRFNETVTIYVRRPQVKEEIPYLLTLKEDKKGGMVDYNYISCSGDCGSCK